MKMTDHEQFLAERSKCLGGSDAGDLLGLPPYGCERKLWFEKKGVPADFEFEVTNHVRRGQALEEIAFQEFYREFKAAHLRPYKQDSDGLHFYPDRGPAGDVVLHMTQDGHVGVHVDRFFKAEWTLGRPSVLEIKVPTVFAWRNYKRLDAPPQTWTAQVQWGLMVSGCEFGALYIFNPDAFTGLKFDVKPDPEMHKAFRDIAEVFWTSLSLDENPCDKLPDGDARCYSCRWRTKCKGIGERAFDPSPQELQEIVDLGGFLRDDSSRLVTIVDLWEEAKRDAGEATKYKDELKDELMGLLKGPKVLMADGRKLVRKETVVPVKAHTQNRVTLTVIK